MFGELDPHPYLNHPYLCHPRTGEPLRAVGVIRGRPVWPVLGGAPDDDKSGDDKGGKDDDADGDGDDDDADGDGDGDDDADGDGDDSKDDKKKLPPEDDPNNIEYWKRRSRRNERAARKAARELNTLKGSGDDKAKAKPNAGDGKKKDDAGDDQPDLEQVRADARKDAQREVLKDRVSDKIEAKATAFADASDAAAILLREHEWDDFLDENDKIDIEAITEALTDLGKKKKHLLAQGKQRFQGGGDGGARQQKPGRPKTLGEALNRHYAGNNK